MHPARNPRQVNEGPSSFSRHWHPECLMQNEARQQAVDPSASSKPFARVTHAPKHLNLRAATAPKVFYPGRQARVGFATPDSSKGGPYEIFVVVTKKLVQRIRGLLIWKGK